MRMLGPIEDEQALLAMTKSKADPAFAKAGTLFVIAGIVHLGFAADDALLWAGVLEDRILTALGTITEIDHTGNMVVSFTTEEGREVVFETASLSDPPNYDQPYVQGETITVAYKGETDVEATIADQREWIRIATLGLFGAILTLWGWLGAQFGFAGVIGELALWLGFSTVGQAAIATVLGF